VRPLLCALVFSAACMAQDRPIVLRAMRMFDAKSGRLASPGVVVVQGGKIQSTGASAAIPQGAEIVELGDATLLPGLIDAHTHLSHPYYADFRQAVVDGQRKTVAKKALDATEDLRKTLMAGFTKCRDLGSGDFIDVALRNAVASGKIAGGRACWWR
jgi:imidazolonepropionase-like amidohydrolase